MKPRTKFRLAVAGMVAFALGLVVLACVMEMAANDWDWRCLFAQCRIERGQCP